MEATRSDLTNYYGEHNSECPSCPVGNGAESEQLVYPSQEAICELILDRINLRIPDPSRFTKMDFRIYLPISKKVLLRQTAHRICRIPNVLPAYISKFLGTDREGKRKTRITIETRNKCMY